MDENLKGIMAGIASAVLLSLICWGGLSGFAETVAFVMMLPCGIRFVDWLFA